MELRSCLRSSLKLPIEILYGENNIPCITKDFGLGGMYLELENAPITMGEDAKILFTLHHDNGERKHVLNAKIAHTSSDGIGLSFSQLDKVAYNSLQELLKYTRKQNLH